MDQKTTLKAGKLHFLAIWVVVAVAEPQSCREAIAEQMDERSETTDGQTPFM